MFHFTLRRSIANRLSILLLTLLGTCAASAHPVPREFYDRVILVRLTTDGVIVHYSLQVDDWTIFRDVTRLDRDELARVASKEQVYDLFARKYGPILADNLIAKLDGNELFFRCTKHRHEVLDHVRCDFVFRADWKLSPAAKHRFELREGNYLVDRGRIDLRFGSDLVVVEKTVPDAELRARAELDLQPGDDDKLRRVSAIFENRLDAELGPMPTGLGPPDEPPPSRPLQLHDLLFQTNQGLVVLLCLAAFLGAVHALTPGHGKTMVAAYLVGQHGTVWHAMILGLVTTLAHTGAVLALAGLFLLVPSETLTSDMQILLGFVSGIMVTGLGFWLLMRRLQRRPDHFHVVGHDHHHHDHDHDHGSDHHHHDLQPASYPGVWGLVVLGVSGGIVPCWDAIALFVRGVFMNQPWLTLALLVAFSAGLAAILVVIGILVVTVKGFAGSKFGEGRIARLLPLLSAIFIMLMGLWLAYDSLHPHPTEAPTAAVGG